MNKRLSGVLDLSRWIAALAVVFTHTSNVFLARMADTPHQYRSGLLYLWVFVSGFGHQAVTIFFVLSGFLVGGRLLRRALDSGSIEWSRYALDRVIRISLVLIPALLLTLLVDRISMHYLPDVMHGFVKNQTNWPVFIANALSLQNVTGINFGSDGPLGTLANEFWYYFTFPLLLGPFLFRRPVSERIVSFGCGVALCVVFGVPQPAHLLGFILWGLGVAVAVVRRPFLRNVPLCTMLVLLALVAIRLVMRRGDSASLWKMFVADLILSLAFANLLLTFRFITAEGRSWLAAPIHARLAGFSFSLYACHKPLLYLCSALAKHYTGFGSSDIVTAGPQWLIVLTSMGMIFGAAYLFSLLTERNTLNARKAAYKLFHVEWREKGVKLAAPVQRHPSLGQEPDAT